MTNIILSILVAAGILGIAALGDKIKKSLKLQGRNKKGQYTSKSRIKNTIAHKSATRIIPVKEGEKTVSYIKM